MSLTHKDVKEILDLLDASPFDEMHLETEGLKLTLRKSGISEKTEKTPGEETLVSRPEQTLSTDEATPTSKAAQSEASLADNIKEIRAPMLGTFYSSSKPGDAPFVSVGDQVQEDTVVCILEVMKLMNAAPAKVTGKIVDICAEDGDLVEFDQVLFRVKI